MLMNSGCASAAEDPLQQCEVARIGAQRVHPRFALKPHHTIALLFLTELQPAESVFLFPQHSVDLSDLVIADITSLGHLLYLVDQLFGFGAVTGGRLHLRQHERNRGVLVHLIGSPEAARASGNRRSSAKARAIII